MKDSGKGIDRWVPKEEQIVRLKRGVATSHEFRNMRRVAEEAGSPLDIHEEKLYEVVAYEQNGPRGSLRLRNVNVQYLIGKRLVSPGKEVTLALDVDFFELAKENEG